MANKLDVKHDVERTTGGALNRMPGMLDFVPGFEDMLETFFGNRFNTMMNDWPVTETANAYILTAEVPGIPKEDIEINVNGNLLTIRAERKEENSEKASGYRRQYRRFQQSFSLPTSVDADAIQAHYDNGILEVMLPKAAQTQAKRIEVKDRLPDSPKVRDNPADKQH